MLYTHDGIAENLPKSYTVLWVCVGMVLFTQLMLLSYVYFDHRLAVQLPYGIMLILLIASMALGEYAPFTFAEAHNFLTRWYVIALGFIAAIFVSYAIHLTITRIIERTDWSQATSE